MTRLPSDGRDVIRDLNVRQYNLDVPDALLLAGVTPGTQEGRLARISPDGILQVEPVVRTKQRAWEPWDLRATAQDATGQDCFYRYIATGTTIAYCEPQLCEGYEDLQILIQPGTQSSGGALSPYAEFRIYLSEDADPYAAMTVAAKTWTNLASAAKALAWGFSLSNVMATGNPDARNLRPVMFDFFVRADASSTTCLIPFTVRVLGR